MTTTPVSSNPLEMPQFTSDAIVSCAGALRLPVVCSRGDALDLGEVWWVARILELDMSLVRQRVAQELDC